MKYRWNQVKQLIMALLMVVVVGGGGLGGQVYASSKLENGTYTIKNQIYHESQIGQGMARSYTEEESELKMSSDGLFATVGFNNTQFMGDFKVTINSKSVSYELVSNDPATNIKKIQFPIPSVDTKVTIGLYVIPMSTEVSYELTFDKGSLKLIEKEVVKEAEQSMQSEVSQTEGNKTQVTKPESTQIESTKVEGTKSETSKPEPVKQAESTNKVAEPEKMEKPVVPVKQIDEASQVEDESKVDKLKEDELKEDKLKEDELKENELKEDKLEEYEPKESEIEADKDKGKLEEIVAETLNKKDALETSEIEETQETESQSVEVEQTNKHMTILVIVIVVLAAGVSSIYFFKRK